MRVIMAIVAIVVLLAGIIAIVVAINKKHKESAIANALDSLDVLGKEEKKERFLLHFELKLMQKLNIDEEGSRLFLIIERAAIAIAVIILTMATGVLGITLVVCFVIYTIMDSRLKMKIENSGITRINDTIAFMDYFVPSIASGKSASQAFTGYIEKLDKETSTYTLLYEYWMAKDNGDISYSTPEPIKDICSIYENALYNEQKGVSDYLYIIEEAKMDLFQRSSYYNDFNSRMKEVIVPTSGAYYIGVPVIIAVLYGSFGSFWHTIWGVGTAICLVILFTLFQWLLNKLSSDTVDEIL